MNVKKPFTDKVIRFGVAIFIVVSVVVLIGGCDRHKIRVRNHYYDYDNHYYDHDITVYPSRSRLYVYDTGPRYRVSEPRWYSRHDDSDRHARSRRSGRTRGRRHHGRGR